jgi:hypothetical protein
MKTSTASIAAGTITLTAFVVMTSSIHNSVRRPLESMTERTMIVDHQIIDSSELRSWGRLEGPREPSAPDDHA